MDRHIRDRLQIAGASDEYIMSRMVEVSIHKPTEEERRSGRRRRRFLAGPEDYIKESLGYLRTVARYLEMEEPSLLSMQHSIGMVMLHWLTHDDVRVWRAPAEGAAIGLATTFFPEVLRFEFVHLYDEDTAGKFSHRSPLGPSPLPAAMEERFAEEWQRTGAFSDETDLLREGAKLFDGLPDDIDFSEAVRIKAGLGNPIAKTWLRKFAEEDAAERASG
jgi:hypothetical protein